MARKKGTTNVSGKSIKDILNTDIETFNKWGESDLRRNLSRLVSAGNKRIVRLENAGIVSPAYHSLGTDKRFTTKLPSNISATQRVNKLRQEFSRLANFLKAKTSSITGAKRFMKESYERLSQATGYSTKQLKNIDLGKVYSMLHKLQEQNPSIRTGTEGSPQVRDYIIEQMIKNPNITEEELFKKAYEKSMNIYDEENDETEEFEFDL